MAIWKDIAKCICLSVAFLLICIFVLWPSNVSQSDTNPDANETTMQMNMPLITVNTTQELHSALKNSVTGSVIQLTKGVYTGQFILNQDNVIIRGRGESSILQLNEIGTGHREHAVALQIYGNHCQVQDLKITSAEGDFTIGINLKGWGHRVTSVQVEGFNWGLVAYSGCRISKVSVKNGTNGFYIYANGNSFEEIQLENITSQAMEIAGNNNRVETLTCEKCAATLYLQGSGNNVSHVDIKDSMNPSLFAKVVLKGTKNLVDHLRCDEKCLSLQAESRNSEIRNSVCEEVYVQGTGHNVFNLDAGKLLEVKGSGHRVENSKATKFLNTGTNVTLVGNIFGGTV